MFQNLGELRRFLPPLVLDILEEKNRAGFKDNSTELKNSEPVQQAYVNSMPAYWTPMDESADALVSLIFFFSKFQQLLLPCLPRLGRFSAVKNCNPFMFYLIVKALVFTVQPLAFLIHLLSFIFRSIWRCISSCD